MWLAGRVEKEWRRPRLPRVIQLAGYGLFFLIAFIPVLVWTFPLHRFTGKVEQVLTEKLGRRVRIASLRMTLGGDVVLHNAEIEGPREEPPLSMDSSMDEDESLAETPRLAYLFEEVLVDIGFWDLLFGQLDVSLDAEALGGDLHIAYEGPLSLEDKKKQKSEMSFELALRALSLAQVHDIRTRLPLPLRGVLNLTATLQSETGQFAGASGHVGIDLKDVVLGKAGEAVLVSGMPMTVEPIAIASLDGQMKIAKGKALVEQVVLQSKHFELKVQGGVELRDPVEASELDLYFVFKILDAYRNLSSRTKVLFSSLESLHPELQQAKRDDGAYGFRYRGRLGHGRFIGSADFKAGPRGWLAAERERMRQARDPESQAPAPLDSRPLAERFGVTGQVPGAPPGMVETPPLEPPQPVPEVQE
ncbi:MAG: type II secretion system protein GspN [Myxococcota bacterium]|jgi:type II secretion system protein N|nr:type II secretion system protein GspN [Myxococcota bacterium]